MTLKTLRDSNQLAEQIEAWPRRQGDTPTRSEAVRRLLELGLKVKK
jgi:hypothetical protein